MAGIESGSLETIAFKGVTHLLGSGLRSRLWGVDGVGGDGDWVKLTPFPAGKPGQARRAQSEGRHQVYVLQPGCLPRCYPAAEELRSVRTKPPHTHPDARYMHRLRAPLGRHVSAACMEPAAELKRLEF